MASSARYPAADDLIVAPRGARCAGVVLPDALDLESALARYAVADAQATARAVGRVAVPGGTQRVEITYPELIGVRGVSWVYVGWRGWWRVRHQVANIDFFTAADLPAARQGLAGMPGMADARLNGMIVNARYCWAFAAHERLVPEPIQPGPSPRYGSLVRLGAQEVPVWG